MKVTNLPAYRRLKEKFIQRGYSMGIVDDLPIYVVDDIHELLPQTTVGRTIEFEEIQFSKEYRTREILPEVTVGHYVGAIEYGKIKFEDIPQKYRTRSFFLHALSGANSDLVEYVKNNISDFDRQFFKDHIVTEPYALHFKDNDFEYMPLSYVDEEMVMCAMFTAIKERPIERRGDHSDWFYSVQKRKPDILTQDLYIMGARCFGRKINGENQFLNITPTQYQTPEYYFALCQCNNTPVMEDIPDNILTDEFLLTLLNDNMNVQAFSQSALERELKVKGKGTLKIWQIALYCDAYQIRYMPLNDERVEFFLSLYDESSTEYKNAFETLHQRYLYLKNHKVD